MRHAILQSGSSSCAGIALPLAFEALSIASGLIDMENLLCIFSQVAAARRSLCGVQLLGSWCEGLPVTETR